MRGDPAALGVVLRRLIDEDEQAFDSLFDPSGGRTRVAISPELAAPLREAGLVEGDDDQLWGLYRVRRLGRRCYFLELGEGRQYHQDVWPETDALLDVLGASQAGRFLDVGTGCGIIAIEAAARGHSVVATDLYETAVELARFNARLNAVEGIDFRVGHLLVPVAGERFDLLLTAPHYGRVFDQLRLEVLRAGLDCLSPNGRLFLATALEWDQGGPLGVESVLRPIVQNGAGVRVTPIVARGNSWFDFQVSDGVPGVVSRHRFLVEVHAGGSQLVVEWPPPDSQPTRQVVPLSRLKKGARAAAATAADADSLAGILERLAQSTTHFQEPLPSGLLDACRWGARPCVGSGGAAGAIVDVGGAVRPCTHGGVIARADDSLAAVMARLDQLAMEASAARGCRSCSARAVCSRCLFPVALDEGAYCDFVRAHAPALPLFHRLMEVVSHLGGMVEPARLDRWPRSPVAEPAWPELTARWSERSMWILREAERVSMWWISSGRQSGLQVDAHLAWLGALVGDGVDAAAVEQNRIAEGVPPRRLRSLLERLAGVLGVDPATVATRTSQ